MSEAFEMQWRVEELVPHAGRMSLLASAVGIDDGSVQAELTIRADDLFFDTMGPGCGVGAWVGIEYMAQAVAACAGLEARRAGGAPKIGFLLGSRRYHTSRSRFALGERLLITVRREFQADNGLGQFDCRIDIGADTVASAKLTVFGPSDPVEFLNSGTNDE